MSHHLYFAYGSNMHHGQLAERCPSARFFAPARLADHRLEFTRFSTRRQCGVLDILPAAGETVWGGLFSLAAADIAALDLAEFVAQGGYNRIQVSVTHGEKQTLVEKVIAYQVAVPLAQPVATSTEYLRIVLTGARHCGLPEDYVEALESLQLEL